MSLDQCHSTVGELPAAKPRSVSNTEIGVTGKAYWRGLDDVADTPEFRDMLEKEFPSGASQLLESSRRTFLKLMGASVALAGAATLPGCRRPDHTILPYSKEVPEDVIPGKSLYYATSVALPGGAVEGLVVESFEGRPTKIEGNPLHPGNNGKSSARAQAAILGLYDPDRLKDPVFAKQDNTPRSWADFAAWCAANMPAMASAKGQGLAFLVEKRRSPARDAIKKRVMEVYPKAMWIAYDPTESDGARQATGAAFGKPMREVLELGKADVVVSLDRDFLFDDPAAVRNTRGFAAKRQVLSTSDTMSRIYCVESTLSVTGSKADHRLAMAPSQIGAFAAALAQKLMADGSVKASSALKNAANAVSTSGVSIDLKFVDACAADLLKDEKGASRAGKTLICCGPTQPASVQALVIAMNAALGNLNQTVKYRSMGADEAASSVGGLNTLVDAMNAGAVTTLVCLGVNPVYDAPGDLGFAKAMARVAMPIVASVGDSETVAAAATGWKLPMAHDLESWGDLESVDGTVSPVQPMIAPLFGARSGLEILAIIAGDSLEKADGHAIVQAAHGAKGENDKAWKRALFNGVFSGGEAAPNVEVASDKLAAVIGSGLPAPATADRFDVVFTMGQTGDGSMANNGWLQELSDPITKIVWDNVALISASTAARFGLDQEAPTNKIQNARMITVTVGGQSVNVPAWVSPGIPDNTVVLQFGYGRTNCGRVGDAVGFNVYPISGVAGSNRRMASGATVGRASEGASWYAISSTQSHGSMEGRALVREVDLPAWVAFGADPFKGMSEQERKRLSVDSYKKERDLNFAEMLGELSHTPANYNAYVNPQRGLIDPPGLADKTPTVAEGKGLWGSAAATFDGTPRKPDFASGPQWGMSIDMTTCTGCGACTTACQAENNIPIVGKTEVRKQRDMQWIRVDRYFSGDSRSGVNADSVVFQPVACVHCENAPCETVCPVNATVHGPEGINYMVYNRCIGTRYCANNCPYKVRRFNFFDYGVKKFNGDYIGKETLGSMGPNNVNLVPPRLRERLDEITKLGMNPNVTVRSRGVMEKCNYCLQRINEARIQVKLKNLAPTKAGDNWSIPDGFFQVACQQACPADSIVFGDINDTTSAYPEAGGAKRTGSRLFNMRENGRSYLLLGYLNTRPRTTHMVPVRNPNPVLVTDQKRRDRWKNPFGHGHDDHGGHDHAPAAPHGSEGDHAPAAKPAEHGLLFDKSRLNEDRGYKMTLAVLGVNA